MVNKVSNENRDSTILEIIEKIRSNKKPFAARIEEISDFPCENFQQLKDDLRTHKWVLWSYQNHKVNIYELFSDSSEGIRYLVAGLSTFLLPLTFIALSFLLHWYYIFGIVLLKFIFDFQRKMYARVLLRAAKNSELYFCFLYCAGEIGLKLGDESLWKPGKNDLFWDIFRHPLTSPNDRI